MIIAAHFFSSTLSFFISFHCDGWCCCLVPAIYRRPLKILINDGTLSSLTLFHTFTPSHPIPASSVFSYNTVFRAWAHLLFGWCEFKRDGIGDFFLLFFPLLRGRKSHRRRVAEWERRVSPICVLSYFIYPSSKRITASTRRRCLKANKAYTRSAVRIASIFHLMDFACSLIRAGESWGELVFRTFLTRAALQLHWVNQKKKWKVEMDLD